MKSAIPGSDNQLRVADGEGAGEVNCVGASKSVSTRQPASAARRLGSPVAASPIWMEPSF